MNWIKSVSLCTLILTTSACGFQESGASYYGVMIRLSGSIELYYLDDCNYMTLLKFTAGNHEKSKRTWIEDKFGWKINLKQIKEWRNQG